MRDEKTAAAVEAARTQAEDEARSANARILEEATTRMDAVRASEQALFDRVSVAADDLNNAREHFGAIIEGPVQGIDIDDGHGPT